MAVAGNVNTTVINSGSITGWSCDAGPASARLPFAICAHCDAVRVSGILLSYSERETRHTKPAPANTRTKTHDHSRRGTHCDPVFSPGRIVWRAALVSGGSCSHCRSVVSDAVDAIRATRVETPGLRALFRNAGRQLCSVGRLLDIALRDICFWRALTPASHWDRRPTGPAS